MFYPESLVWLPEERVYGTLIGPMGAYFSTVKYTAGGIEYEVLMENTEFELLEDFFDYDGTDGC